MLAHRLITPQRLGVFLIAGCSLVCGCASIAHPDSKNSHLNRTIYSDDGASELSTPATWASRPNFGPDAAIRVAKESGEAYLLVNSYFPGDLEPVTSSEFADEYAASLASKLPDSTVSGPEALIINDMEAYRHIVTGGVVGERVTYVTTVVDGTRAMHHVIGWVATDDYSGGQDALNRITNSFRESTYVRPPRQRVALRFDWPQRLQSVAAFHQLSVKQGKTSELKAHYLSTVRPGNQGELIVSTRVVKHDVIDADSDAAPGADADAGKNDNLDALFKHITTEIPDYVVSKKGKFVRVDNLPAFQQRIETAVESTLPINAEGRRDEILAIVRPSLSERFLEATVTNEWNKTVGSWANSSYAMGETYHFREQYYAPSLGKVPFAMDVSRQIAGFVPCNGSALKCVRLIHIAKISGEAFRSAMTSFLEETVGQPVNITRVSVVKKREIIAEPGTLIPHRSRSSEETVVVIEDNDGKTHMSRDTKVTRVAYSYETQTASR